MSRLRGRVRRTKTSGSKIYATVESVSLGEATVRLARNGARLTNLPVHGVLPRVGDRVIVDYSSEGKPYVRRLTVPDESSSSLPPADWEEDLPTLPPVDEYGGGIPAVALTACKLSTTGSLSVRIGWSNWSNSTIQGVAFDKVDYDLGGLARMEPNHPTFTWYGFMGVGGRGKYLVRYTMAFPAHPNIYHAAAFPAVYYSESLTTFYAGGQRWGYIGDNNPAIVIVTGTAIVPLYHEEQRIVLAFRPFWSSASQSGVAYVDFPYEAGKYPILEAWKIADVNPSMLGEQDWKMTYYLP